jgi:hypothetical protein
MTLTRHISVIVVVCGLIAAVVPPGHLPSADAARPGVGISRQGQTAVEYIGIIQQTGPAFTAIGFLTHIDGLEPADLFTNPAAPSAATARFTFSASAGLVSAAQVGSVTQIVALGPLRIFFNEAGGADFATPSSFEAGTEIAAYDVRFHNVLAVIAPNQGVAHATADAVQTSAEPFSIGERSARLGRRGLDQRITFFGGARRTQESPPISTTEFAASGVTQ